MFFTKIHTHMDDKDKIEKIMQLENLNSAQFATEIGIQGSTLSHILNGRNKPSLDVLKKIMNRFRTINPEWLILDIGTMYRQEKHSQMPSLFADEEENDTKSIDYAQKEPVKTEPEILVIQTATVNSAESPRDSVVTPPVAEYIRQEVPGKLVKKVIVYYTDNTFQEFQ